MTNKGRCEALIFVSGEEGIKKEELLRLLNGTESDLEEALNQLREDYNHSDSAIQLEEIHGFYHFVTKPIYGPLLESYASSPYRSHLSKASLETLAIIAYEQPVTRLRIDEIRGVNSSTLIKKLVQLDLIEAKGRQDSPGRPVLYVVTEEFYRIFGVKTLDQLKEAVEEEQNNSEKEMLLFDFDEDE